MGLSHQNSGGGTESWARRRVCPENDRRADQAKLRCLHIDSGANAEQKEALRKLFSGPSFAGIGQEAKLKEAAIKFENLDAFGRVGKTASGTVGEIAGGTNRDEPLVIENQAEPGLKWTAEP